jgi:CheY-like chemotaxis protein
MLVISVAFIPLVGWHSDCFVTVKRIASNLYPSFRCRAMNGKNVLLVDHKIETSRNAAFLLGLAGYRVRRVADAQAALNWITNSQVNQKSIDLILLSNWESARETFELIPFIYERNLDIPVLIVVRDIKCKFYLKEKEDLRIKFSIPEDLIVHVRSMLE